MWRMKGRSKLQRSTDSRWFGTADHAAPTARTMRTSTESLRCVLSVDTRLFSLSLLRESFANVDWGKRGWINVQQCWQVRQPCRSPGGRNMWFVYENTQRRKSKEGKTKRTQPIGSRRGGCQMWVNQSDSTLCESPLWASDRRFRAFACSQRVIWKSKRNGIMFKQ